MSAVAVKKSDVGGGYKQTELGLIPEDWDIFFVEDLLRISTGGKNTQDRVDDGQYPFFVRSQKVESINTFSYDEEAVLTAGDGVGTGKVFHYIVGKYDAHQRVYRITGFSEKINGKYFYRVFSDRFYDRIMQMTAKSSVDSVRREMISRMLIPVPTVKEQEAIAEALSDADALIESLKQLIAKKRQIKQGAMQDLLTGQKRFAGFSRDWKYLPLNKVCELIVDGTHFTPTYVSEGIPFYSVENVTSGDFKNTKFITDREHQILVKRCKPQKGDILMTRIGSIGDTKLIDWDVNASIYVSLALLRPNKEISPLFLYMYTKSQEFVKKLQDRSLMNAIPQKINMGEIGGVLVPVPEIAEQQEIASVMDGLDKEISSLEIKLEKAKQIKQGMMQDLLTGRVRLI